MKNLDLLRQDFTRAVLPPLGVLFIHLIRLTVAPGLWQADPVLHFLGGFSIAWMSAILWKAWTERKWIPKTNPPLLRAFTIWGSVALVGVFWEFMEFFLSWRYGWRMQFSIGETMSDLALDLIGALVFLAILRKRA